MGVRERERERKSKPSILRLKRERNESELQMLFSSKLFIWTFFCAAVSVPVAKRTSILSLTSSASQRLETTKPPHQ